MDMGALRRIVAANIVSLRTANHMTQLELGEKLNYSDKAISRWERGEAVPGRGCPAAAQPAFRRDRGLSASRACGGEIPKSTPAAHQSQNRGPHFLHRGVDGGAVCFYRVLSSWPDPVAFLCIRASRFADRAAGDEFCVGEAQSQSVYHLRPELEPAGHGLSVRVAAELVDSLSAGHPRQIITCLSFGIRPKPQRKKE